MVSVNDSLKKVAFSTLDVAAIACAFMLSLACLVKGAVYDSVVAVLLLVSLPILWLALAGSRSVHPGHWRNGTRDSNDN